MRKWQNKNVFVFLLLLPLLLGLASCTPNDAGEDTPETAQSEETVTAENGKEKTDNEDLLPAAEEKEEKKAENGETATVSETGAELPDLTPVTYAEYAEYHAFLRLGLPENWDHSVVTSDYEKNPFGLSVFRKDKPETRFQLLYYPDVFGVCGTGLIQKNAELSNGKKVKVGYYDDSPVWSFIVFEDVPGSYAVIREGESDKALSEEFFGILGNATLGYTDFGREDAERLAKENVQGEYKYVLSRYDHINGVWNVRFYNDAGLSECKESISLSGNAFSPTPKAGEEVISITDGVYNVGIERLPVGTEDAE